LNHNKKQNHGINFLGGNHTSGELPKWEQLADFKLIQNDLSVASQAISQEKDCD
jgi:hypothetical protein